MKSGVLWTHKRTSSVRWTMINIRLVSIVLLPQADLWTNGRVMNCKFYELIPYRHIPFEGGEADLLLETLLNKALNHKAIMKASSWHHNITLVANHMQVNTVKLPFLGCSLNNLNYLSYDPKLLIQYQITFLPHCFLCLVSWCILMIPQNDQGPHLYNWASFQMYKVELVSKPTDIQTR